MRIKCVSSVSLSALFYRGPSSYFLLLQSAAKSDCYCRPRTHDCLYSKPTSIKVIFCSGMTNYNNNNNNNLAKENVSSCCYLFLFKQQILNLALKTGPLDRYCALGCHTSLSFIVIPPFCIILIIYLLLSGARSPIAAEPSSPIQALRVNPL